MARRIFEDNDGLYFRAYNKSGRLVKVYCDEEGNPIKGRKVVPIEVEQEDEAEVVAAGSGSGVSFKKIWPVLISLFLIGLVAFAGFFAYNKFANANPKVDITSGYDVSFSPTGSNGEAKAGIKVNKIPTVENIKDEAQKKAIEDILNNPRVSYSKTEGLRNGDNVEVTVVLDETKVKNNNLDVVGSYKKSFKVEGLSEKAAVESINPSNRVNNNDISSTESGQSTAATVVASTLSPRAVAPESATPAGSQAGVAATPAAAPSGTIAVPRTVNPAAANIRSGAGTNTAIMGTISRGKQVTEIRRVQNAKGETWSQVSYGNGKQGWIRSNLLG